MIDWTEEKWKDHYNNRLSLASVLGTVVHCIVYLNCVVRSVRFIAVDVSYDRCEC